MWVRVPIKTVCLSVISFLSRTRYVPLSMPPMHRLMRSCRRPARSARRPPAALGASPTMSSSLGRLAHTPLTPEASRKLSDRQRAPRVATARVHCSAHKPTLPAERLLMQPAWEKKSSPAHLASEAAAASSLAVAAPLTDHTLRDAAAHAAPARQGSTARQHDPLEARGRS